MRQLKLWNGRSTFQAYRKGAHSAHVYVAAYSVADIRRLCVEVGYPDPGYSEIKNYWHARCWGRSMDGITPERGIWIVYDWRGVPERLSMKKV